jgi:hypothetical protein
LTVQSTFFISFSQLTINTLITKTFSKLAFPLQKPYHAAEEEMQDAAPRLTFTPHFAREVRDENWRICPYRQQRLADLHPRPPVHADL